MQKVAVDTLNELAKLENQEVTVELGSINGAVVTMNVKRYLSMRDFNRFISEMRTSQFGDDNDFRPQFGSIVYDVALCEYYSDVTLPSSIEDAYELVQCLDLKRKILDVIDNTEQFAELTKCINEAHIYARAEKTGFNGFLSVLRNAIENFDVKEILETLKDFDLEKLQHLPEIKELAKAFNTPQIPNKIDGVESNGGEA